MSSINKRKEHFIPNFEARSVLLVAARGSDSGIWKLAHCDQHALGILDRGARRLQNASQPDDRPGAEKTASVPAATQVGRFHRRVVTQL